MTSPAYMPSIAVLDELPPAEFVSVMAPLFEGAPWFLGRLGEARPFGAYDALWTRALAVALAMPEPDQLELIDAHPRLGAAPSSVSALSFQEQGYDQDGAVDAGATPAARAAVAQELERVAAEMARLNAEYEAHFGFRYCVFVNHRTRAELLPIMAAALTADRPSELIRALTDIVAIAHDRATHLGAPR